MGTSEQGLAARAFYGLVAVALIAGVTYGTFSAINSSPAVGGSIVTALGAVLAVVAARHYEQRQQIEQARRDRISKSYEKLISTFIDASAAGDASESAEEAMREVIKGVLLWGSQDVVAAINAWRQSPADPASSLLAVEAVVHAMRTDIGSKNDGLATGDLLRTFVNDFDQLEIEFGTPDGGGAP